LPTAFRVWKFGPNPTDKGTHIFTRRSAELLMQAQALRGNLFSIDVDHMSLNQTSPPESRKAVGWHRLECRGTDVEPDLWVCTAEWTDTVRGGLTKSPPEWRYFSPAYDVNKDGEIVGYLNTALTNNPATWDVAALASMLTPTTRPAAVLATSQPGNTTMNYKQMRAALLAMAGDDEDKKAVAEKCIAAAFPNGDPDEKKDGDGKESEDGDGKDRLDASADTEDAKKDSSIAATAALLVRVEGLEQFKAATLAADTDRERQAVFASRSDISAETKKLLANEEPAKIRAIFATIPQAKLGIAATKAPTRGADQRDGRESAQSVEDAKALRIRMGLEEPEMAVTRVGASMVFPAMTPEQAKKNHERVLATRKAG
jgi:phage I-like protein